MGNCIATPRGDLLRASRRDCFAIALQHGKIHNKITEKSLFSFVFFIKRSQISEFMEKHLILQFLFVIMKR